MARAPLGKAVERGRRAGHGRDRVEQDFGRQELGLGVREIEAVVRVQRVGGRAELIGAAVQDRADQLLEVVAVLDEVGREAVEQLVVAGGVGVAEVVDRLDDPPADQVKPDPVDQALGEERVVGARQPGRQADPPVFGRRVVEDRAAQRLGLHLAARARLADVARPGGVDHLFVRQIALLAADLREEGGEAVIVVLRPALERVVVALGALNAHAQEELRRGLDGRFGIAADPVIVGGRVLERRAVGRQQLADQLVHRQVALQALANPAMEDVGPLGLDQSAVRAEDVGELQGPEVVKLGTDEEPVDDVVAASGGGIRQERPHFIRRGQDRPGRRGRCGG